VIGETAINFISSPWVVSATVCAACGFFPFGFRGLVRDGRARWKIENEKNNVLKTKGYYLEHNFGHGSQHISPLLLTLNLLAFLFHTVLDLVDQKYRLLRKTLRTRRTFFQALETLLRYFLFDNWDDLLSFMCKGPELNTS
jgi:hypothetical protein